MQPCLFCYSGIPTLIYVKERGMVGERVLSHFKAIFSNTKSDLLFKDFKPSHLYPDKQRLHWSLRLMAIECLIIAKCSFQECALPAKDHVVGDLQPHRRWTREVVMGDQRWCRRDGWILPQHSYLWRCGGGGGSSDRWGRVTAPTDPGHDFLRDVLAALVGISDTDLGGQ